MQKKNPIWHVPSVLFLHVAVFLIPWCASWPFSANSVWCVSCCLDPKAPASSTAPSTAVVWHVCKHTSTGWVSRHPPAEKWAGTYTKTDKGLSTRPWRAETNTVPPILRLSCSSLVLGNVLKQYDIIRVVDALLWFQLCLWDWPWDVSCSKGWGGCCRVSLVTHMFKACRGSSKPLSNPWEESHPPSMRKEMSQTDIVTK